MSIPGKPARKWDGIPDHRTPSQRKADQVNVRKQVAYLSDSGAAMERSYAMIRRIQARQDEAPPEVALPFDLYPVVDGNGRQRYVLLARGQLLVRVDSPDGRLSDIRRILRDLGYEDDPHSSERQRDRRTEVFYSQKRPDELVNDIEKLRGNGIVATFNLIVPLGPLIKGDEYPSATSSPGTFTAPPKADTRNIRVAVVDTGITAEDRKDDWLDAVSRTGSNVDPIDVLPDNGGHGDGRVDWYAGHGTFASGIVQRVAPQVEVVVYKFTKSDGLGTDKDAAEAMLLAAEEGAGRRLIINASFGSPAAGGAPPAAIADAVQLIQSSGEDVLIVASAGNDGTDEPMYPAACTDVVSVGALTDAMAKADFSNFGTWLTCSAVGVGVVSTYVQGIVPPDKVDKVADQVFGPDSWGVWTGTSFSAPQIAGGVAALCWERGLSTRAALDDLLNPAPNLPGYGKIVRILPGTPV